MFNQKLLIGLGLILVLSISFLFRDNISRILDFGQGGVETVMISPPKQQPMPPEVPVKTPAPESSSTPKTAQPLTTSGTPLPKYDGRDPEEVKPAPGEVKLFSEDQKGRIFGNIRMQGKTVKTNPTFFSGWIEIGILKKTIGDFEGAKDAWEYASLIEPGNSVSFSNLGELYWRYLHKYVKSESNFRASISNRPYDTQNYVSLAELYHYSYKEKYELADDVLLEGLKVNPEDETLMRRLAYLYEQRQEWPKALEWWEKVSRLSPEDQTVQESISRVKGKIGG